MRRRANPTAGADGARSPKRGRRRTVKLVLLSVLLVGALGSITIRGVYAVLSSQEGNPGSGIATGTLTMGNTNAGDSASTTLTQSAGTTTLTGDVGPQTMLVSNVGSTTLTENVGSTTLTQNVGTPTTLSVKVGLSTTDNDASGITVGATQITVSSTTNFPTTYPFYVQVGSGASLEIVKVTSSGGPSKWNVTRAQDGTTAVAHNKGDPIEQVSVTPASTTGYPASGFNILVGGTGPEEMTITATISGVWIVSRGQNGTTAAAHTTTGVAVTQVTVAVNSSTNFPASGFTILVDSEQMTVNSENGTTWEVSRAANGSTAASHSSGATVNQITLTVASGANFPSSGSFGIQIDNEQMTVTAGAGGSTWTVTRAVNSTTAAGHSSGTAVHPTTITVASSTGYPASGFTIQVDGEQMTVTGESGTGNTTWAVTRGVYGTTPATHSSGAAVAQASIPVTSASNFPSSGSYAIQIGHEQMTVTNGQGTTTWIVTRAVNGTSAAAHSSGATVNAATISVNAFGSFPSTSDFTVLVDSEKMMVVGGQGTSTWTVRRAVDGTSVASHSSGATVATPQCQSYNGAANANSGCDSLFTSSAAAESYPGAPTVSRVTIANTGSVDAGDLELWMPTCLRAITPDSPLATTTPGVSSFSSASGSGGNLSAGIDYYYEITAVVGGVQTVFGTEGEYGVPGSGNSNQVTVNWSAVPGATSYDVYRSQYDPSHPSAGSNTYEGGEQLLATGVAGTSYADTTNTAPSGYPPSEAANGNPLAAYTGAGNPCVGGLDFYVQEVNAAGSPVNCVYPPAQGTTCSYSATYNLGLFYAAYTGLGSTLLLGSGPSATSSRYFKVGIELPSDASNAMQGTEALFTLHWYMSSASS